MTEKDFLAEPKDEIESSYNEFVPVFTKTLNSLTELIHTSASDRGLSVTIRLRVKSFSSWHSKFLRSINPGGKKKKSPVITDILGIRIICPFLAEVDLISKMLQELFIIEEHEVKGADLPYHHFGYESVHFLVAIPKSYHFTEFKDNRFLDNPVCEIQVRTILQEAWAEVEHELVYKSDFSPLDEPLKRKLAALNANLTLSDIMFQEIRDYQREFHSALKQRRKEFYRCISQDSEPEGKILSPVDMAEIQSESFSLETVDTLLLRGLLAHNRGGYNEAIEVYSNILLRDISDDIRAVILVHRGMSYFSSNMHDKAIDDFNKAIDLNPGQTKARYYRAVHARVNENFTEAFADIEKCIKAEPYNLEYLTARAETLAAAGDSDSAMEECRIILRMDPDFKPGRRLLTNLEKNQ